MAAIERRSDLDTLQYVGDGLRLGLAQGVMGAALRAGEHIAALRNRDLDELSLALEGDPLLPAVGSTSGRATSSRSARSSCLRFTPSGHSTTACTSGPRMLRPSRRTGDGLHGEPPRPLPTRGLPRPMAWRAPSRPRRPASPTWSATLSRVGWPSGSRVTRQTRDALHASRRRRRTVARCRPASNPGWSRPSRSTRARRSPFFSPAADAGSASARGRVG